ncbi:hypothetical protein Asp14428_20550 [Actinoplanes sp. NBRC 14428]|uniref:Uncharacterized protein n=1 Tax=Pseudosporangium ferrugineum TaxID=439699 RepID=A0A2T0RIB7_9ACTN|nr:hypothetical protein [Pseudosporangium ferrugineum]PRY20840.1 hypothetical protein CLV70_12279 [Pseudosporangium ferrugineum]BCJ50580.1 hypothetical protein Asp14428_20550 [Actinoplanes sp. NBRC 14428]
MIENDKTERATEGVRADRRWIGMGVVAFLAVAGLKGLIIAGNFADGPLRHWYVQAGIVAGALALYAAGEWLIGRGYRRD